MKSDLPIIEFAIDGLPVQALQGETIGPSEWREVTQEDIDSFADLTGDHQWIHTDVERAKNESPFGTTVAHGNLTLSLIDGLRIELLKSTAGELGLPYREMRSQAGHDAYAVATMAPTAMIFTPCFEGISHNVNEAIELGRSVPGANLLLNAAVARANR